MEVKQVLSVLVGLVVGVVIFNLWVFFRPDDPSNYKIIAAVVGAVISSLIVYFSSKE